MAPAILEVSGLSTHFVTRQGVARAVDDVSFRVARGEILGLVGESGCGKSMTALSLVGLVDAPGRVVGGRVLFQGDDLLRLAPEALRRLRGNRLAMILQDPMLSLNPVLRIDTQLIETLRAHQCIGRAAARERALKVLGEVGIASPAERLLAYPHQLSGGMRQRVAIAIALLNSPDLIIADEPTTALDVTIQGQILALMQTLCRERRMSLLWITHDLTVVAGLADRVAVMYAGRIVESGTVAATLARPLHPYTQGLLAAIPARQARATPLAAIAGNAPALTALPAGCAFRERCPRAFGHCHALPDESEIQDAGERRTVRCWLHARTGVDA